MCTRRAPAVVLHLGVLLLAASPPDVVLVQPSEAKQRWPALEARTESELRALGLDVVQKKGRAESIGSRRVELVRATNRAHATAALRLARRSHAVSIELWVTDGDTGKMRFREIGLDELPDGLAPERYVSLAVVEMVQGALLEIGIQPHATTAPIAVAPSDPTPVPDPEPAPRVATTTDPTTPSGIAWSARLAAVGGFALGGLPGRAGVGLGVTSALDSFELGLDVQGSFLGSSFLRDGQGFDHTYVTASIRGSWVPWRENNLHPEVGVALGAFWLHLAPNANAPMIGRDSDGFGFLAQLLLAARLRIAEAWTVRASIGAGVIAPSVDVNFADTKVASFGPLVVQGGLGVAWCFANGPC